MKILCVIDCLGSGGAQRQLVELAFGFKERGHEVAFLTYHDISFYNATLIKKGINITCIEEPNYLKRLLKMRQFIRRGNYDAVLSFLESTNLICEIAGLPFRKWKLVVGERSANPNIQKSFKLRMYRWFHFLADAVVANSHANIKLIQDINPLMSKRKYNVIYNIVNLDKWKPFMNYKHRINGKFRLIIAASHAYLKNLNSLVESIKYLDKEEKESIEISWYGDKLTEPYIDNSLKEARRKIKDYGLETLFKFYPATHNLPKIISEADAVGLFSKYEGLPNIVCEAMVCEKLVICSKVSDVPQLLNYDQNLLCDWNRPSSIAKSIKYILKLDEMAIKTIGKKNREIALHNFDKDKIINQYLNLLS